MTTIETIMEYGENGINLTNKTAFDDPKTNQIFTDKTTRICLIAAYTFVFLCCFFGNFLVIIVVVLHRRMKTVTNFFLTNLAFADLCVGLFCVYQNLSLYLSTNWAFGDFLCRMYHFIQTLSYTASITILTIICVERYLAIIHPIWSKQVLTLRRLKVVIVFAWLLCGIYCSPRLVMYGVITVYNNTTRDDENICIMKRSLYDSKTYDLINFVVCFLTPLLIISVLYFIICLRLWTSKVVVTYKEGTSKKFFEDSIEETEFSSEASTKYTHNHSTIRKNNSSMIIEDRRVRNKSVLRIRKRVIRLLVIVVLAFAISNLPFHARKLWQGWSSSFKGTTYSSFTFTIVTTLIFYMNSGINPIIYAFMSMNFRKCMVDVLLCRVVKGLPRNKAINLRDRKT
ncbi:trissin receptor [Centruroides vittatus]|uniref:trissin receptor n=1 Tax=Centruroides vittatus TaxID=120091 RepID=UPI0035101462